MSVAMVDYWPVGMRGGEEVLTAFARKYLEADVFTRMVMLGILAERLRKRMIKVSITTNFPQTPSLCISYLPPPHQCARGLICSAEKSFGIVSAGVIARRHRAIAFGRAGRTEKIVNGRTEVPLEEQLEEVLIDAISRLKRQSLNSADITKQAHQLDTARFERQMREVVSDAWTELQGEPFALSGIVADKDGTGLPSRRKATYA